MKDIKGYEGLYGITSCGKVWSYRSKKFLSPDKTSGYERVILQKNGDKKRFLVHRLVADAYIPNPNNLPEVDHIDGNKRKNCANNLQWMSGLDNTRKANNVKVRCIQTGEIFDSITLAAKYYNVSHAAISNSIRFGWKAKGNNFEYLKEEDA